MEKDCDGFERFYEEETLKEPAVLRQLIEGWEVLEGRGTSDRRILLIRNAQGEKRILKQFSNRQSARMRAELTALEGEPEKGVPRLFCFAEDDRYVYLMREYVEGLNLEELVTQRGKLSLRQAARIGRQLCEVLERLHRRKIIHRDVKPQNVILTPEGQVYLIDFDISRKYTEGEAHDTEYLGTRSIAPPEQFGYGQTDVRTDIYSLGVMLLYLMTGSYDLRRTRELPAPMRLIVRRCTYFAPERRFQKASQVRWRLMAAENRPKVIGLTATLILFVFVSTAVGIVCLRPRERVYPMLATLTTDATVTFHEPLIEQCVRAQLGKPEGETLRYGDLANITEIYIYGDYTDGKAYDPDYRGDRVYVNGQVINQGAVTDLTDLLLFSRLRVLRLFRQPVSNVDALAPLTKLEELSLDESPNVTDISAVSKLQWLRTIDLSDTSVKDLSPLSGCPRLRQINLERVPCKDFSVLSQFSYLEFLNVNEASPEAVTAAVSGKMIDYLWLDYSGLTDIEPFVRAESVEQLHAKHNRIRSLEGIEALTMLYYVDVAYNPIEDLSPLLALPRLNALRVDRSMEAAWDQIKERAKFSVEWEN